MIYVAICVCNFYCFDVLYFTTVESKKQKRKQSTNMSWAQVALRYIVQSGATFTTQSTSEEHFRQNLDVFEFELSAGDMSRLANV